MSEIEIVRSFLRLPVESLPRAVWMDDDDDGGSCWPYLVDFLRSIQKLNHFGSRICLWADRDGWRDGVIVRAG